MQPVLELRLRGATGSIVWNYQTVATLSTWSVVRGRRGNRPGAWTLSATVGQVRPFELRQVPLLFAAPRKGGFFLWPVLGPPRVDGSRLTATLGPPEQ